MFQITTTYPDGTQEVRDATPEEITQREKDDASIVDSAWRKLREERNQMLAACDWTVLTDTPTSTTDWKAYRQALRDLPASTTDPLKPVWPTPPT